MTMASPPFIAAVARYSSIRTTVPEIASRDYAPKRRNLRVRSKIDAESSSPEPPCAGKLCSCGRRRLIEVAGTVLLPTFKSNASDLLSDSTAVLNRVHPPRSEWYEELYATTMATCMQSYEAEIAGYKSELFNNLKGKAKEVLEIGIGTGPNLKYYASDSSVHVFGIDPNKKMKKYAQAAALDAGLPDTKFKFIEAVAEALPFNDASVDAVVGTLVLCSVKDVGVTLKEVKRVLKPGGIYIFVEHVAAKDGTFLKFVQGIVDPLQQVVADGCHLTRESGNYINEAGFSGVDIKTVLLANASIISPHVYGIASV